MLLEDGEAPADYSQAVQPAEVKMRATSCSFQIRGTGFWILEEISCSGVRQYSSTDFPSDRLMLLFLN